MAEGKDHLPPLEDVVHAFIAAQNDVALANDMRRVLASPKIVLLVDGLDEARGGTAPDTVLAGLTTFVEMRNVPVIATSRPHGMRALSGIGGNWTRLRLAPLSETKRDALALLWYRIPERSDLGPDVAGNVVEGAGATPGEDFHPLRSRKTPVASRAPFIHAAVLRWRCSNCTGPVVICTATA